MSEYSIYPKAIDGYAQMPLAVDKKTPINAESVNRLRSAIINIEKALGISPQGGFATTSARIESLEGESKRLAEDLLEALEALKKLDEEVERAVADSAESISLAEIAKGISEQAEQASSEALDGLAAFEAALAAQVTQHNSDKVEIDASIDALEAAIAGISPGSSIDTVEIDASIDALEAALAAQVTQHNSDKVEVDASIDALEAAIAGISPGSSIDTVEIDASIDALEAALAAQVTQHNSDKVEVDASIDALEAALAAQVTQHNLDKAEIDASIDALDSLMLDNSDDIILTQVLLADHIAVYNLDKAEVDASIDALEAAIAGISPGSSIDTVEIDASIDALEAALVGQIIEHSVDKLEVDASIDALEAAIAGISPGSSIDTVEIDASIDALEAALVGQIIEHSVDKLEVDASIDALEADLFLLESDLSAQAVAHNIDVDDINSSIDNLQMLIEELSVETLSFELLGDTTPQLGGDLDLNGSDITGSGSIVITGDIQADNIEGHLSGDLDGPVVFEAYANVALSKGDVVYISGISGNNPTVELAQANAQTTMPAFGLAMENIAIDTVGKIVTFGSIYGLDAGSIIDTGNAPSLGSPLYVSATVAGKLCENPPPGESNFIQNIGKAERVDPATNMTVKVGGAGRTNATPALDSGNIFYGNASNESTSVNLDTTIDSLGYAKLVGGTLEALKVNPEDDTIAGGHDLIVSGGNTTSTSVGGGDLILNAGSGPVEDGEVTIGAASTAQIRIGAPILFNAGMQESFSVISGATGSVSHDCSSGHIFLHQGIVSNFTADLTNLALQANKGTTVTLVLGQGSTPFIANGLTINGSAAPILWQGGSPPTGGVGYDALSFSILYDGSSYYVLGQLVEFG